MDNKEFSLSIERFVKTAKGNMETVIKKASIDILGVLVASSPVDTGRFRANWQVTANARAQGEVPFTDKFGTGADPEQRELVYINSFTSAVHSIYFTNNVVYAYILEMGHSKRQAPGGIIRANLPNMQEYFDNAARELSK
ncbi:hypothetical protein vBSlqSZDD2_07 [Serratia phage vB_SlqS_ZDD2]|nr:hypothetical protein vBSlqSZDD2_07 [Serratia phage vB_SlqS_ZDD2]